MAQTRADANEAILLGDEPQVQGLADFEASSLTTRVVVQVKPGEQYAAERDFRQRLKRIFDRRGVEIPLPQRTAHTTQKAETPHPTSDPLPPNS